tara:strand:+ start:1594 stop:2106 length:513 start_codon:yes stop_codon:yes gene_type:complete
MSNTNAQEQKIQDQIKEQFQKAFYDTIKHSIQNKNHDHIIRLYVEIQDRLATMLKKDGPTHQRLINDFDIPFFEQRLRNNAFDGHSMTSLVQTTFAWIHNLQMPLRDHATEQAKRRVLTAGTTMEEVVPVYIKECHGCLDLMEKDMKEFYENRNHPVVQEMMRRAVGARK